MRGGPLAYRLRYSSQNLTLTIKLVSNESITNLPYTIQLLPLPLVTAYLTTLPTHNLAPYYLSQAITLSLAPFSTYKGALTLTFFFQQLATKVVLFISYSYVTKFTNVPGTGDHRVAR